ncbi:MAG: hypothetical protein V5A34_12835 [Halapricum sp.]
MSPAPTGLTARPDRTDSLAYADGEPATIPYRTNDPGPMVEDRPARDLDGDGSSEEGDGDAYGRLRVSRRPPLRS